MDSVLAVGGIIGMVSVGSYYIIEQPTRRRAGVVPWIVGSFLLTSMLAFGVYFRGLAPDVAASSLQSPVWHGARFNLAPRGESPPWVRQLQEASVITTPFEGRADAFTRGGLMFGPGEVPEIVVLGDSHAAMWSNSLLEYANLTQRTVSFWSIHGVDPFVRLPLTERSSTGDLSLPEKLEYDRARLELIERWQPKVVILAVRWPLWGCDAAHDLLRFLEKNASHVLLLGPVPESDIGDRIVVQYLRLIGQEPRASQPLYMKMKDAEMPKRFQAELELIASQYANASVVPLSDLYSRGENVRVLIGNQTVYLDDDHLTEFGAQLGKQRLADAIEQAVRGQRLSP